MRKLIFLTILLMGVQLCYAATINVPGDYSSIRVAVNHSSEGDTVLVEPGTYNEYLFFAPKNICLLSTGGREVTIIKPLSDNRAIFEFWEGDTSIIDGFTITGAYSTAYNSPSVGIYCRNASPTIQNCEISYNMTLWHDGAGFYIRNSGIKIYNNLIHHNDGSVTGGGIACHGEQTGVEIVGNIICANSAPHGSGIGCPAIESGEYSYAENIYIADNLIFENIEEPKETPPPDDTIPHSNPQGYMAAGIYINGYNCQVMNNTIVDNPRGIMILEGAGIVIEKNIIAFNNQDGVGPGSASMDCNDVYGNGFANITGPAGFSLDPMFCRAEYGEFGLTEGSPCLPDNNSCGVLIGAMGEVDCIPRIVISIDRSGSMAITGPLFGLSRFEVAQDLARNELLKILDPGDPDYPGVIETAIMYFNADGIVLHQDFTTDSATLHDAILSIPSPRHDTPLAAAMCQSLCTMIDQGQGTKWMITYTDGLENESQNFEICNVCRHCNQFISSGWNYDCDPSDDPTKCTDWQLCLSETFASRGTHVVHYFGETVEPINKSGVADGLEDMLFLKAAADNSYGRFYYHSDLKTICGDANYDGGINVSDAVYIVNYVFIGGDEPTDYQSADSNCDGTVNVSDAVQIINFIFVAGPEPCADCK
jgi:hypothetical protein